MKRQYKLVLAFLCPGSLVSFSSDVGLHQEATALWQSFLIASHSQHPLCHITFPVLGSGLSAGGAKSRVKASQTCTS